MNPPSRSFSHFRTLLTHLHSEPPLLYKPGSSVIPYIIGTSLIHAVGLFFFGPLGDLLRRRQLILTLILCSFSLTLCLALVPNWNAFLVLSFFAGLINVIPQVLVSLAVDLAPPSKRAFALSIVVSGLILGILIARVFAGLIAQFADWRVVYYFAVGMQGVVLVACYALIPDYPVKNQDLGYWELIRSMVVFAVTEPLLIQVRFFNGKYISHLWLGTGILGKLPLICVPDELLGYADFFTGRRTVPLFYVCASGLMNVHLPNHPSLGW